MKLNKLFLVGVAVLTLVFTNCNTSDDGTSDNSSFSIGNTITSDFAGKVVDSNNNPMSGVAISMSGQTTTTDASGNFTLNNISVKENFAYVTATKTGFINGSRTVVPHEGINNMKIMLLERNVVATIPTGQSTLVTLPTGTKITFDGAFVQENGSAYTGNVNISMNYLSPTDPNVFIKMPGSLLGQRTDGSLSGMETYGMVNVEMYGDNNEKLQLESGHTANISMPIAANQLDTATATIPLWYFNETTGLWQEQGFSRKIGNRYIGNVSHFTWWNNDCSYVVATLHVTVKNADGTLVQGVRVTITRQNGSTGDVLMDLGVTGANGQLSAGVPRNEVLTFKAYTQDGTLINTQQLPASNELNRYVTVIIPVANKN
ncbi:carboxypeptidase-like regulatory domain-containing protein [Flavobacterium sp. SUN052]|uniref:carboxypeptidase-like regulatory domain-containing protein n=1 Tax=Flavobacterium sp. SUN052 TaxID=3002441 RepID=UPI00237DDE40|nr:carboxypeptidase-like regulatory domain-containing protein [Flavobacterium sp. SUN052]MEC4005803.1 carboxypeptidase-like regulatory domain-containing protein [Flavobacterium sp. SUN052]